MTLHEDQQREWLRVLDRVKSEVSESAYRSWLQPLKLHRVERIATVIAPTRFLRDWVTTHYESQLFLAWLEEHNPVSHIAIVTVPSAIETMGRLTPRVRPRQTSSQSRRPSAPASAPKNSGGAPAKYDWEALWFELMRIAQVDEFHSRQELRQRALDWIAKNWADEPSDSVLREKLRRLGDTLGLPVN